MRVIENILTVVAVIVLMLCGFGLFWAGLTLLKLDGYCLIGGFIMICGAGVAAAVPSVFIIDRNEQNNGI